MSAVLSAIIKLCIDITDVITNTLYYTVLIICMYMYSGPSLSGYSQQRAPSLIRPQLFATTTINLLLPLTKGHPSNVATISWQIGWPY